MLSTTLQLWNRTLRVEYDDETRTILSHAEANKPLVMVAWHNRLFVIEHIYKNFRHPRSIRVLVSASRDGAWLSGFCRFIGMTPVRGSSSFRSKEALKELEEVLAEGHDVGITPDGPRGPKYRMKNGVVHLARKYDTKILLINATFHRAYRCKSWDAFFIPYPFSRVTLHGKVCTLDKDQSLPEQARHLTKEMMALSPE